MVLRLFHWAINAIRSWKYGSTRIEAAGRDDDSSVIDDLSESCLRGLRKKSWIVDDRLIATEAFIPDVNTAKERADCCFETSVNWEDDENVVAITLADRRSAEHGAARVIRNEIAHVAKGLIISKPIWCERAIRSDNPHHGNIVFSNALAKIQLKQLAAAVAVNSTYIKPHNTSVNDQPTDA